MVHGEFQDVLRLFSASLNFNIRQFKRLDGAWGSLNKKTGEWNGMISNLKNGEADMITATLNICCKRTQAVDFLWPMSRLNLGFAIKRRFLKFERALKNYYKQIFLFPI